MAILTLRAELFFMDIFLLMTSSAGRFGVTKCRGFVAFFALQLCMATSQDEPCLGMIVGSILPTGFLMAGFAFGTQLVLMQIILAVA